MAIKPQYKIPSGGIFEWLFGSDQAQIENDVAIEVVTPGSEHDFLTYGQLRSLVLQLASGLKKAGLKPGDRVLLAAPNCLLYTTVMLAVITAGGAFLGASNSRTAEEFQHWMNTIEPSFVLVHRSIGDNFTAKSTCDASFYFLDESSQRSEKTIQGPYNQTWPHWSRLLDTQVDLSAAIPQLTEEELTNTPIVFTMTSG
jgi:acyl-CoA synthetase (AMP-forming)/AMP-acid ligase II